MKKSGRVLITVLLPILSACGFPIDDPSRVIVSDTTNTSEDILGELEECGYKNGLQVRCSAGTMCATVAWEEEPLKPYCYPLDICKDADCPEGMKCVLIESWPARAFCLDPVTHQNPATMIDAEKLQVCPDEWIIDAMPQVVTDESSRVPSEYFILGGMRRELDDFDIDWVNENCDVSPREVM